MCRSCYSFVKPPESFPAFENESKKIEEFFTKDVFPGCFDLSGSGASVARREDFEERYQRNRREINCPMKIDQIIPEAVDFIKARNSGDYQRLREVGFRLSFMFQGHNYETIRAVMFKAEELF